jgi:hypothetical protein
LAKAGLVFISSQPTRIVKNMFRESIVLKMIFAILDWNCLAAWAKLERIHHNYRIQIREERRRFPPAVTVEE